MKLKKMLASIIVFAMILSTMSMITFSVSAEDTTSTVDVAQTVPNGTITPGYTRQNGVWGEATSNSEESFYIELYSGEDKIAKTTLNNVGGIIDGDIFVTWSIPFAGSLDEYWTVEWEEGHPTARVQPTNVVLYSDGVKVAENVVQMNGPDNLNPVEWRELEALNLSGEGTAEEPFIISNLKELKMFRDDVNDGDTYNGKFVKLTDDIDLNNEEWTPIGNSENKFQGTFDGDNHTISNLLITGVNSNVGLFGFTSNGEVKNLTVENACVSGYLNVGVVAGTPYTSKYTNINVTGHVEVNGMAYVGGMFGKNLYANATNLTINVNSDSYVKATSTENDIRYRTYVGGVVGFMGEGPHGLYNVVSNIDVIGDVTDIGGITGIIHYGNKFVNITSSGNVTGTALSGSNEIGGIAGTWHNQNGTSIVVDNCNFTGTITAFAQDGTDLSQNFIGKILGDSYIKNNESTGVIASAKIGDTYYNNLSEAVQNAQEGDVIDMMGHTSKISTAIKINKNLSVINGTLDISDWNLGGEGIITIGERNGSYTLNLNNINIIGSNYSSAAGVFRLFNNSVLNMNTGNVTLTNDLSESGGIFKGYDGTETFNLSNLNLNIEGTQRIIANSIGEIDNCTIAANNINNHGFRNFNGSITGSNIIIDGCETGIKMDTGKTINIMNSSIAIKNPVNSTSNAGIILQSQLEQLNNSNSTIDAKIVAGNTLTYYTLTFDTNGGDDIPSIICEENTNIDLSIYRPSKTGYVFNGWRNEAESYATITQITLDTNKTVTALWKTPTTYRPSAINTKYTLTFNTNGGTKINSVSKAKKATVNLSQYTTQKDGYSFEGWYTDKELTDRVTSVTITDDIVLYAKWKEVNVHSTQIILTIGDKNAKVFGEIKANDVAPKIVNDRTMLPARFVAENLGATVIWTEDEPNKVLITKENIEIIIYIGSDIAYVNGKEVKLDSPAFIEDDRTYTPIRFISEELGATVKWFPEAQQVVIEK